MSTFQLQIVRVNLLGLVMDVGSGSYLQADDWHAFANRQQLRCRPYSSIIIITVNLLGLVIDISAKNLDIWSPSAGQRYGVYCFFMVKPGSIIPCVTESESYLQTENWHAIAIRQQL